MWLPVVNLYSMSDGDKAPLVKATGDYRVRVTHLTCRAATGMLIRRV